MELNDFQQETPLTVSDFGAVVNTGPSVNERTAAQVAAVTSIMGDADPEKYRLAKQQIMDPNQREAFVESQKRVYEFLYSDAQEALPSLLADPSLPDTTKMGVISSIKTTKLPPVNTLDTLAEEAAIADSGYNESERAADSRSIMIDEVRRVNKQKRDLTAMINGLHLGEDSSFVGKATDFAEFMVPFAEWRRVDNMLSQLSGAQNVGEASKTFNLLGQQKAALYEKIKAIPLDKRIEFAQQIMDLIDNNENMVLPDGNDIAALNDLHKMLIDDDYSNTERWIDNISSILDVFGMGMITKAPAKVVKGVKTTTPAPTLAEEAQAFTQLQKEAAKATSPLAEEAKTFKGATEPTVDQVFPPKPKNRPADLAKEAKAFKSAPEPTADTVFRQAVAETTRTDVVPTSPSQTVKDFNPELARQLHAVAANDETGEASKALYGSSKTEALAKDLLPEPQIKEGALPNKVEMRRPEFEEPEMIKKARSKNGNTIVSEKEMTIIRDKLISGFEEVEGMVLHPASMVARTNLDGTMGFTARYSPLDSGFSSPEEALTNAKFAFRHYGLNDENFTILARNGSEWVETSLKDVKAKDLIGKLSPATKQKVAELRDIDYAIGMKYDYKFSPDDWEEADLLTTAPGLISRAVTSLDYLPTQFAARAGQGSIVQNLLDAASVIHPQILNAASVAVDRVFGLRKLYVDEFKAFSDQYAKMSKVARAKITDYIHKANLEGVALNAKSLYAQGFSEEEVNLLKAWRRANDIMWYAANDDLVMSLRSRGMQVFTHETTGTKLFGRPMAKVTAMKSDDVFDPTLNTVGNMDKAALDKLYDEGGTLFRLPEPTKIDGKWVDTVISREKPTTGYLRRIYDGEIVLSYRDGYYPVMYDANYFVTKQVTKGNGEKHFKVIASARNKEEVKTLLEKVGKSDKEGASKGLYSYRMDRDLSKSTTSILDEGSWRIAANSGLTSQRVRGERLMDAGVDLHKMGNAHLKDPLEAVANQIQQLSQRVAMRPYLDAVKKRWMINYGKYLDLKISPKTGRVEPPSNVGEIVGKSGAPARMVKDARTNYNYIAGLENGYINLIDEGFRATLNVGAQLLGELGLGKAEEILFKGSRLNPTQKARTAAFKFFISASPLRQAVVQRGQMLQLGAINPKYLITSMAKDLIGIDMVRAGVIKSPDNEFIKLFEEIKTSGILEAVDAHTLARTDMLHLADLSTGQKTLNVLQKPLEISQKVGFDAAEQDVLISSWLAHRDLALKAGKDLKSQRVQDEILGQARAFTLNMNRAGEMPYSQATLGMAAQFFSFRHKALLQGITNRSLDVKDRLKLLAYTTAMFGVEATLISAAAASLLVDSGEPTEVKDMIKDGLLDTTLNAALTLASGDDQQIDFGDMAPSEAYGMGNVFFTMIGTPISDTILDSPSGSLLFGHSPRVTDAFKTMMRYFNVVDDYEDPEMQTRLSDVIKASLSTFSGFSGAFKAEYAFKTRQKMSSTGRITDSDVTAIEALAATFGFQTKTETGYARIREMQYGDQQFVEDDVKQWYKELKRHLARQGKRTSEDDMPMRVLSEAWRVFGEDRPRAVETILQEVQKDANDGDYIVLNGLLKKVGFITNEDMWKLANNLPPGKVRDELVLLLKTREEMINGE